LGKVSAAVGELKNWKKHGKCIKDKKTHKDENIKRWKKRRDKQP
jgi:hypothetical protein